MEVMETYIGEPVNLETGYNHIVLEAAIRAIESDSTIPPYIPSHVIDLRSKASVGSVATLRDLIRMDGFELDLNKRLFENKQPTYHTPYDREVKRAWQTNHWMIMSEKGWLVLDTNVESHIEIVK